MPLARSLPNDSSWEARCTTLTSLLFLSCLAVGSADISADEGVQFVFVSQPRLAKIVYLKHNLFIHSMEQKTFPLVTAGLKHPLGVAFDKQRQHLYVADPEARKVCFYKVILQDGNLVTDGLQYVAMSGIAARWVAVDGAGTVFASDETQNTISKVSLSDIEMSNAGAAAVFSGGSAVAAVSSPGGVVADGRNIFWANKVNGDSAGSVVRGSELPDPAEPAKTVKALSNNIASALGICADQNNVFYSTTEKFLYGVKKDATTDAPTAVAVADSFVTPRGCAWDGDGTIYVADKNGNALYAFASEMQTLGAAEMKKLVTVEDPFGVAVYHDRPHQAGGNFLFGAAPSQSGALRAATVVSSLLLAAVTVLFT